MKYIRKIISVILTILIVLGSLYMLLPMASAASNTAYYTDKNGNSTYYSDPWKAWNRAVENNGTFGILSDWDSGRRVISEGHSVSVELNGHVLTRRKAKWSSDGEVIYVDKNASLTVYGGTKDSPSSNSGTTHSEQAYVAKKGGFDRKAVAFKGGLIHGGNSSNGAGGIHMKEGAQVNLYYTTVAGNRAEQTWNSDGFGGGIMMDGANCSLYLDHSTISYNYAYNDGGGVFVHKNAQRSSIEMISSHIDKNVCIDNGAGIGVDAEHFRLLGDTKQITTPENIDNWNTNKLGSSVSHNYLTDSDNSGGGAGIYLKNSYALVKGVNLVDNNAYDGGNGGALYIREKNVTVKECNVINNSADAKGGGVFNSDSNNTVENCSIYGNSAGSGGGIFAECKYDMKLSGSVVIRGNSSGCFSDDNLFLAGHGSQGTNAFIIPSLKRGADVHIRIESSHMDRVSTYGSFRDDCFSYDNSSSKHIEWSDTERCLRVTDGEKPIKEYTVFNPDNGKTTRSVAGGYTVNGVNYPLIKGIAELPSCTDSGSDVESVFYYSDGYFMGDTANYNEHLAALSMNLAGASGYSNTGDEYLDKSNNFRQFMSDIGCKDENIYVNDYNTQKPSTDTIGVGIASKKLPDDSTLVIIGVRGMGYEAEWVSNMTLGTSGEAKGFSSAATQVFAELKNYLDRCGINGTSSKTKFWIAGYSRAGATSNLTAKRIVDAYDNGGERTYAYPVEAPKGGLGSLKKAGCNYGCIHNIVNQNDIVPWVGTTEMGFIRYGIDHYVPGSVTTNASNAAWDVDSGSYNSQKAKMKAQLKALNSDIPFDDYFHGATINYVSGAVFSKFGVKMLDETDKADWTTEEYIELFFEKLQEYALFYGDDPRTTYSGTVAAKGKTFEQAACVVAKLLFGKSDEDFNGITSCFMDLIDRLSTKDLAKLYLAIRNDEFNIFSGSGSVSQEKLNQIASSSWWQDSKKTIWSKLTTLSEDDEACGYHAISEYLTPEELKELESSFDALMIPVIQLICMDYKEYDQNLIGTTAFNISRIISNHYPEVTCAWLRSYDSFYKNDTSAVMMASSVKRAPSAAAVKITNTNGDERFVYSNNSVISVKTNDKVSFVPTSENDRDAGEAIYYNFSSGKKYVKGVHAFSRPLILGNMRSDYATNGIFSINTKVTHYGQTLSERTFRFQLEGTCTFQTPESINAFGYSYKTQTVTLGDTVALNGLKPDSNHTYRFREWKAYRLIDGKREADPIDAKYYSEYFGESFDPYSEKTNVTNNVGFDVLFRPEYITVISELNVDCNSLMDYITCTDDSGRSLGGELPVVWKTDDSFCYTGTFKVPIPIGSELADDVELDFDYYNSYFDYVSLVNVERIGSDAVITMDIYADFSDVILQSFYEVEAVNVNTGNTIGSVLFCKETTSSGDNTIRVMAPSYPGMEFVRWSDDINITSGTQNDENIIINRSGVQDNKGIAYYRPIVNNVKLTFDKNIKAGETMPNLGSLTVMLDNEWRIDNAEPEWIKNDTTADYRTVYTAHVTVDKATMTGTNLSVPNNTGVSLVNAFSFAENTNVSVEVADGSSPEVTSVYFTEDEKGIVSIDVTFAETQKQKLTSQAEVTLTVPYGSTAEDILSELPETVTVFTQSGLPVSVSVEWSSVDMQHNAAQGTVVSDEYDTTGLSVTAAINVLDAEKAAAPTADPPSGDYSGILPVTLKADDDVDIYYAVSLTEQDVDDLEFVKYTEPITLNQYSKQIILYTYSVKDGVNNSDVMAYTYELTKPLVTCLEAKSPTITENGNIACFYSTKTVSEYNSETDQIEETEVPDVYYTDDSCTEVLNDDEVTLPAYIKASYTVTAESDPNISAFGFEGERTYSAFDILGVQPTDNTDTMRIVAAADSRILRDAADYGCCFNGQKVSCKGTSNGFEPTSDYQYLAADITLITSDPIVNTKFYVTLENGEDEIYTDETALDASLPNASECKANISVTAGQAGDVNNDGEVNISDAYILQRYLADFIELTPGQKHFADANGDGYFTIRDVMEIQRHAADYITLPVRYCVDSS